MGRVGEVICRTWQTAHKMKVQRGLLSEDAKRGADNFRARRYIAKTTINPALTHGIAHEVGSVEVGKLADWCCGTLPSSASSSAGSQGRHDRSGPHGRPQWVHSHASAGALPTDVRCAGAGSEPHALSFVSQAALDAGIKERLGLASELSACRHVRGVRKADMKLNDACPDLKVDPQTYEVRCDGELLTCEPASELPLAQRYHLF